MHSVDRRDGFLLRLRLVTSQGSPYPSRSPWAHPSVVFLVSYKPLAPQHRRKILHAYVCEA